MSAPIGIPSPEEIAAGAYPWDTKVRTRVIPCYEIALLTWGSEGIGEEFGLSRDTSMRDEVMWGMAIRFFWSRVSRWDGTVEDVWMLMQGCDEREILLRRSGSSIVIVDRP